MSGVIVFDPDNEEVGLSTGDDVAVNTYLSIESDTLYFTDGLTIYEWEGDPNNQRQTYIWKSGEIRMPSPVNMGAALVEAEAYSEFVPPTADPLYDDVIFLSDWEGDDDATAYTELSKYAEAGTFGGTSTDTRLEATGAIFGNTSLFVNGVDDPGSGVTFPVGATAKTAWNGTGKYMTFEMAFRADVLPTAAPDYTLIEVGDSDFQVLRLEFEWDAVNGQTIRCGFANSGAIIDITDLSTGTDYFLILEADYTGGAGNGVERIWLGDIAGGTATLVNTASGLTAKNPASMTTDVIHVGRTSTINHWDGTIGFTRITVSDTARYGDVPSITIPPNMAITGGTTYNITFRLYADGVLKHTQIVTDDEPFRLPGGYLSNIYSVELEGGMPVTRVSVAENIFELSEG